MASRKIVIVGGGFAGAAATHELEKHLPEDWRLILINEETFMTFTPLLPEVVSGSLFPAHSVAPLRGIVDKTDYIQGCVTHIEPERREIVYQSHGERRLHYDHLVLACGTLANLDIVPGMEEYGLPLKTLGDALYLRNRMIDVLETVCQKTDPVERQRLLRFVVVGGGTSGVEVAGAVYDFLSAACRHYPNVEPEEFDILVMEHGERILKEFPASLGEFASHALENRGIRIQCHSQVTEVTPTGVTDQDGNRIETANVICTVGTEPYPLIAKLPFDKIHGRLVTRDDMSIPGAEGLWAMGDCAAVPNQYSHGISPPTAQFAQQQGRRLADNLLRVIAGKRSRPFSYRPRGELATIGHHRAVALVFGMKFSGRFAWSLWRMFYLLKLPTLLRKVQVYFEWNVSMFFPQDVTQLDLVRSRTLRERERRKVA